MKKDFAKKRFDRFGVMPHSFLDEFRIKDPNVRRYLLNSLTLFASISPEQQHQILNDLIQAELLNLAYKSKTFIEANIVILLRKFGILKDLADADIVEYYYRYYLMTGIIPEELTTDYLNNIVNFILGIEITMMLLSMSFMEQQNFFEIQGNYSVQVTLFYRYIKPIRSKLLKEKIIKRDGLGNYYYNKPILTNNELLDYVFELFNLEKILYLGNSAKNFTFDNEYVYKSHYST